MDFNIDNEIKAMMENPQFELDQQFVIESDVVEEDVVEDVVVEDVVEDVVKDAANNTDSIIELSCILS